MIKEIEEGKVSLNHFKSFRMAKETKKQVEWLLEYRKDKFESESHLIRCAIIKMYNKEKYGK